MLQRIQIASRPTEEFRAKATRLALTSRLPRKQVAADFGIGFLTLNRCVQRDQPSAEKPTSQYDLERDIAEVGTEDRLLREEMDVLARPWSFRAENQNRFAAVEEP